ncbi:copper chaperone PCu(A)C [Ketobacter sp. MCCC 1A13808]|uniref:copper chaperone PCu(A)C n=1 Tax=Ketobacter sp. MCCC 1A13808 TaxID=2602738 RepID=UPI000F270175|nr:copper chaperone PCu(A)C [Ketobacter sp. MCCC 1A13808]MVF12971.1 copper chaperone PCu(A)C [Ketobacter sp. MCCC 1A13808]RLP53818.1 MAG: copper chaperone PCu(A)C [Ketobacter sp.]
MWIKTVVMTLALGFSGVVIAATELSVEKGWVRMVPPVTGTTAAYFELKNESKRDRVLVKASSAVAETAEMHMVVGAHGVTAMRPVKKFDVLSGRSISFEPGGRHIMLIGLKQPLKEGETVTVELEFSDGEKLEVPLTVKRDADDSESHHHHH